MPDRLARSRSDADFCDPFFFGCWCISAGQHTAGKLVVAILCCCRGSLAPNAALSGTQQARTQRNLSPHRLTLQTAVPARLALPITSANFPLFEASSDTLLGCLRFETQPSRKHMPKYLGLEFKQNDGAPSIITFVA